MVAEAAAPPQAGIMPRCGRGQARWESTEDLRPCRWRGPARLRPAGGQAPSGRGAGARPPPPGGDPAPGRRGGWRGGVEHRGGGGGPSLGESPGRGRSIERPFSPLPLGCYGRGPLTHSIRGPSHDHPSCSLPIGASAPAPPSPYRPRLRDLPPRPPQLARPGEPGTRRRRGRPRGRARRPRPGDDGRRRGPVRDPAGAPGVARGRGRGVRAAGRSPPSIWAGASPWEVRSTWKRPCPWPSWTWRNGSGTRKRISG